MWRKISKIAGHKTNTNTQTKISAVIVSGLRAPTSGHFQKLKNAQLPSILSDNRHTAARYNGDSSY